MSDDLPAGTVSLEDVSAASTDTPAPVEHTPEPEQVAQPAAPEQPAVVEASEDSYVVQAEGRPVDIGKIVAAERRRTAEKYEPFRQQAAQLAAEVQQLRQQLQPPAPEPPKVPEVSDEEAAAEAKDLQLYTADSQPDIKTAKRIIIKRRQEALQVAEDVSRRTLAPLQKNQAQEAAAQNFIVAVTAKDAEGNPLFATRAEQEQFAQFWASQPHELTADRDAAETFLDAYWGRKARTTKRTAPTPVAARPAPILTESPGGANAPAYQMSDMEKRAARASGISQKDFAERAKSFAPDRTIILGD